MSLLAAFVVLLASFTVFETSAFLVDIHRTPCTLCGPPIDVTLTAVNNFRSQHFNFTVTLRSTAQRELIHLLQEAADQDGRFNFTVSYNSGLGFFVEAINKQRGDYSLDGSWWHTYSDQPGKGAHCEGVSAYVPEHQESVVFLLTNQNLQLPRCPDQE